MVQFVIIERKETNGSYIEPRITRRSNRWAILRQVWRNSSSRLDVKFQLEYHILTFKGKGFYGKDGNLIVCFYKLIATDTLLALPRTNFVILHSAGFIGRSTEYKLVTNRNGGGDVLHGYCS